MPMVKVKGKPASMVSDEVYKAMQKKAAKAKKAKVSRSEKAEPTGEE